MKISDLPEAPMPDDDAIVGYDIEIGQPRRIMTIGEYLRRRGIVYAHRNGETEAPTDNDLIGTGDYWFKGTVTSPDCGAFEIAGIVECSLTSAYNDCTGETLPKSAHAGKWWGPIVPPWEQAK